MRGLVIGGVASGVGKTTLTLGLIGALRQRGLSVQPYKVGPDYIDPSHHAQAAGRPSRNLDSWMVPEVALRELFWRTSARTDASVIEGVMGLFDGRTGGGELGSTAHVAKLLGLPVLLVVDAARAARSVAATVLGCRALDPDLEIVGVVLNNVASERHAQIGQDAIETLTDVPVLGWMQKDATLRQDERYLGLIPAAERRLPDELLGRATSQVEEHVDLPRLLRLMERRPIEPATTGLFPDAPIASRARIAVAQDAAFNFYYQDSLDLLAAWGAEIVPFSPLADDCLPEDVDAVYLGGGFPELFAATLGGNGSMLDSVRAAAKAGLPIYGECGGLMYLQERLIDADGREYAMAGILPGSSTLAGKRLSLGYREARARRSSPLAQAGQVIRAHEFHWSLSDAPSSSDAAYDVLGTDDRLEGFADGNVLGSYLHVHLATDPTLAPRFVESAAQARVRRVGSGEAAPLVDLDAPAAPMVRAATNVTPNNAIAAPIRPTARGDSGDGSEQAQQPGIEARQPNEAGGSPPWSHDPSTVLRSGRADHPTIPGPLLREHGLAPDEIERLSRRRIEALLGNRLPQSEPEGGLVARLVYAGGDPLLADLVRLNGDPVEAAIAAFRQRAPLIVDVGMVAAGVSKATLATLGVEMIVALHAPGATSLAYHHGITRSAAGLLALAERLNGAVIAIGNAPTALLALLDLVNAGVTRPAAVIGLPVGFVAAQESKAALQAADIPSITIEGTRGGSGLAAAALNYLLRLAGEPTIPADPRG